MANGFGLVDAFRRNGAVLRNPQWSVSAIAEDGALVVSLWEHHFGRPQNGRITCKDSFARWSGPGNNEFRRLVRQAYDEQLPVRVVMVHAEDPAAIESGADASKVGKTFSLKEDWVGRVSAITGDEYEFTFWKA